VVHGPASFLVRRTRLPLHAAILRRVPRVWLSSRRCQRAIYEVRVPSSTPHPDTPRGAGPGDRRATGHAPQPAQGGTQSPVPEAQRQQKGAVPQSTDLKTRRDDETAPVRRPARLTRSREPRMRLSPLEVRRPSHPVRPRQRLPAMQLSAGAVHMDDEISVGAQLGVLVGGASFSAGQRADRITARGFS
jgi:hypothetical protein